MCICTGKRKGGMGSRVVGFQINRFSKNFLPKVQLFVVWEARFMLHVRGLHKLEVALQKIYLWSLNQLVCQLVSFTFLSLHNILYKYMHTYATSGNVIDSAFNLWILLKNASFCKKTAFFRQKKWRFSKQWYECLVKGFAVLFWSLVR